MKLKGFRKVLLQMKLLIILLFGNLMVYAMGFSQTISLSLKNVTLSTALETIERQSDYRFVYGREQIESIPAFDITTKSTSIEEVLDVLFKDKPLTYTISGNYISIKRTAVRATSQRAMAVQPRQLFQTRNDRRFLYQ